MSSPYRLLGISGSLRANSFSAAILDALAEATAPLAAFDYADIGSMPHFNQDLYVQPLPQPVQYFRDQIAAVDGLVIVSSEYNHGIPGVLTYDGGETDFERRHSVPPRAGDHTKANHWMLTGFPGPDFNVPDFRVQRRPSLGSIASKLN